MWKPLPHLLCLILLYLATTVGVHGSILPHPGARAASLSSGNGVMAAYADEAPVAAAQARLTPQIARSPEASYLSYRNFDPASRENEETVDALFRSAMASEYSRFVAEVMSGIDGVQSGLTALGMLPMVGAFFDAANAGIYALRGDYANATLSGIAAIPGYGDAVMATLGASSMLGTAVGQAEAGNYKSTAMYAAGAVGVAALGAVAAKSVLPARGGGTRSARPAAKGCNCFVAGTLVTTTMGLVPIEDVAVGMDVYTENPYTGELTLAPVLQTFVSQADGIAEVELNSGEVLQTTLDHPFWVLGEETWIAAADLVPGDFLRTLEGGHATVAAVRIDTTRGPPVYNFEVLDKHAYYVGEVGVLVHNTSCGGPGGTVGGNGGAGGRIQTTVGNLRRAGLKDAHHIIQDAAVRGLPGYNTQLAPGVQLSGPSTRVGSPHYAATRVHDKLGGGTYAAERRIGYKALRRGGLTPKEARAEIFRADKYFGNIGVTRETITRIPGNRR